MKGMGGGIVYQNKNKIFNANSVSWVLLHFFNTVGNIFYTNLLKSFIFIKNFVISLCINI